MMLKRLQNLFLVSVVLFIAHGLEEYITQFYLVDKSFLLTVGRLGHNLALIFIVYQVILWAVLFGTYALVKNGKLIKLLPFILSIIMVFELQHIYETIVTGKYYPGSFTAVLFPVLAVLLLKQIFSKQVDKE